MCCYGVSREELRSDGAKICMKKGCGKRNAERIRNVFGNGRCASWQRKKVELFTLFLMFPVHFVTRGLCMYIGG